MSKLTKICEICKKEFITFNKDAMFCSRNCYNIYKNSLTPKIKCVNCGIEFKTTKVDLDRGRKYCSKKCFGIASIKIDKTPKICENCGNEFIANKISAIRANTIKFCSRECYHEHKKDNPIDRSKQDIIHNCKYCGKSFKTTDYRLKYGKFYCSDECKNNHMKRDIIQSTCEICGKIFDKYNSGVTQHQKFCSPECSSKSISKEEIIVKCNQCGKDVIIKGKEYQRLRSPNGNFCDRKCWYDYYSKNFSGENSPMWEGGISFLPYCFKFNNKRRQAVRDFFNNTCIICGKHQSEELTKLDVHHVYYNKDDGCDGRPFNLVPLCHACHTRTNHNRDYWEIFITNLLEDMFKYGIFSKQFYETDVMYPEV